MNKFNVFKFHFKKIVWSAYFFVLCSFSLLSVIGGVVASNISNNKDFISQTQKNIEKSSEICFENKTKYDFSKTINLDKSNQYKFIQKSKCNDIKLVQTNSGFEINSQKNEEQANSFKVALENVNISKHLQIANYKPLNINIKFNNIDKNSFSLPVMFVGMAFTVISFFLIMYLISIIFRQIAFEKTNKIWDMTSNKLNPGFLFFTKIISVIFLIGFPVLMSAGLNFILVKLNVINIYSKIPIPKLDNLFTWLFALEFILTFTLYALISGYVALYVKSVEQIQSMIGWAAGLATIHYILALASVQFPFEAIKYIAYLNPFSTLFSMFDSFYHVNNPIALLIIPLLGQIILIIILNVMINKKFKKI